MKLALCLLVACLAVLPTNAEVQEPKTANYDILIAETEPQEIHTGSYIIESATNIKNSDRPEDYRTCLVVRCGPNSWTWQVCICVAWQK